MKGLRMNIYKTKIREHKTKYPRTWSQQLQRDVDFKEYVIQQTSWLTHNTKFSERIYYLENELTEYKKCKCGRGITNLEAETCKKKGCDAFKELLNKNRDKEKHRQSVLKTYEDGNRITVSGVDRATISYGNQTETLSRITELYTLDKTIELLHPVYKRYFGKAGNRKLIKDDPMLYKSVKFYTKELRKKSNTQIRFTGELIFLCEYNGNIDRLQCKTDGCDNIISYQAVEKKFKWDVCCDCFEPVIGCVSIISQELFENIDAFVDLECKYHNNGGELMVKLTDVEKRFMRMNGYQHKKFFVDFVCGDKIIEYDGEYWHRSTQEYDMLRDYILTKRGYNILRIGSKEYNNTKKGVKNKQKVIQKCVEFLNE